MLQSLKHFQFIVDHLLVAFDVFFENDFDGHFTGGAGGFTHDSVRACT
jgi:hypothetical protein